jgi:hypothetical protein
MKTKKLLAFLIMFGLLGIYSCDKDDEEPEPAPPPVNSSISFENDKTSMEFPLESEIDMTITFKAEKKIARVYYQEPQPNGTHIERDITIRMGPNHDEMALDKAEAVYYFQVPANKLNSLMANQTKAEYTFTVEDKEKQKVSATFTVTKKEGTYLSKEVTNGELYHIAGNLAGAWDLEHDTKVGLTAAPGTMFMMNTDADGATFTGSWKSNPANACRFVKAPANFDYAHATEEAAKGVYNAGTPSPAVNNPQANEMYVAMQNNNYYVIMIINVDPSFSSGTGTNHGQLKFRYRKKP